MAQSIIKLSFLIFLQIQKSYPAGIEGFKIIIVSFYCLVKKFYCFRIPLLSKQCSSSFRKASEDCEQARKLKVTEVITTKSPNQ